LPLIFSGQLLKESFHNILSDFASLRVGRELTVYAKNRVTSHFEV